MSVGKLKLRFTPDAQANFRHVLADSETRWGVRQAEAYEDEIFSTLDVIRQHPEIGVSRPDIVPGCRSYPTGRHTIFYRVSGDALEILRILHQRQRTEGQFDDLD